MELPVKLADRRLFWLLITPLMLWWLTLNIENEFLTSLHRSGLLTAFLWVDMIVLALWLKLRERLLEASALKQSHQWLFLLVIPIAILGFVFDQGGVLANLSRNRPVAGFSLQALVVLAFGYAMWRLAYSRKSPTLSNERSQR
jgi:hypothetical protein